MNEYRVTSRTLPSFLPLLGEEWQRQLASDRDLYAIGAEEDGVACGVLLFRVGSQQVDLVYLMVSEAYRRRGCAVGMVQWLCRFADQEDLAVFAAFSAESEQDPLWQLFHSMENFSIQEDEAAVFTLDAAELGKPSLLDHLGPQTPAFPVFQLPGYLRQELLRNGLGLDQEEQAYLKELCICAPVRDKVSAALLFQPGTEPGEILLSYAFCEPGSQKALMNLLAQDAQRIRDGNPQCRTIRMAVTPASAAILRKLYPQARVTARFYTAAWDMRL